jgi:N6-L-threonylcarbamoyladenine synthase
LNRTSLVVEPEDVEWHNRRRLRALDGAPIPRAAVTDSPSPRTEPLLLGIETSCDDTACAVLDGAGRVLSSVVSSQLEVHRPFGGVVPEAASREHLRNWPAVSEEALQRAGCGFGDLGAVAATYGPGLVGSLLVGLSIGKALAYARGLPFFAVHHLEGHLWSPFLRTRGEPADVPPPSFVGLVVSGGHTTLVSVADDRVRTLGETRDDAMGEAFDKVGKRLGLPFPGGPHVDAWAEQAEAGSAPGLPAKQPRLGVARCGRTLDFSYSGLKTQTLLEIERLEAAGVSARLAARPEASAADDRDLAPPDPRLLGLVAEFRRAAVAQLVDRLERLHARARFDALAVSGGVAANRRLRRDLAAWASRRAVALRLVEPLYAGDNAAMIAHAAWRRLARGETGDPPSVEAASRLPLGEREPEDLRPDRGRPRPKPPLVTVTDEPAPQRPGSAPQDRG